MKYLLIGSLAIIVVMSSLQPTPKKCKCEMEVQYFKKGKLIKKYTNYNGSSLYGSGVSSVALEFAGKTYYPDSLSFVIKN
jgi:hypothetical protein